MESRQLRGISLELIEPTVLDTELGAIPIHECSEGCGQALSQVECTPSCPHLDCEDREIHSSAGKYWCPLVQIVERRFAHHQEVGLVEAEA